MNACAKVLERVRQAAAMGRRPVVVFDLDDTLFSTHARHLRILKEFAKQPGMPEARRERARALAGLKPSQVLYSIRETAGAAKADEAFLDELERFWAKRFFKSDYLQEDPAVPGAPEFVHSVAAVGGCVVYLTGRDESMRPGTEKSLRASGFPIPDEKGVLLRLKPRFDMEDLGYKIAALETIAALGQLVAAFENEPSYLNAMRERFPSMIAVLLKTRHSGRPAVPHPEIEQTADFKS